MTGRLTDLRAADVDRAFLAERLKKAVDEGRITLAEYDERVGRVYTARTYGDLDRVIADLPSVVADARAEVGVPVATAPPAPTGLLRYPWWAWLIGSITIITVVSIACGGFIMVVAG